MDNINLLYYNRIDGSKGIESKECDICHYWYFLNKGFKFQPDDRNCCHDVLMTSLNINDIDILNIPCADYHCIISRITKIEATYLMQNIDIIEKIKT